MSPDGRAIAVVGAANPEALGAAFAQAGPADVLNVTTAIATDSLRVLYRAADGVLANSGREPFGLVGLETMAAGGTVYTGNTGEEYARHMQNAVILDTSNPAEAAWYVNYLTQHPDIHRRLRASARARFAVRASDAPIDGGGAR